MADPCCPWGGVWAATTPATASRRDSNSSASLLQICEAWAFFSSLLRRVMSASSSACSFERSSSVSMSPCIAAALNSATSFFNCISSSVSIMQDPHATLELVQETTDKDAPGRPACWHSLPHIEAAPLPQSDRVVWRLWVCTSSCAHRSCSSAIIASCCSMTRSSLGWAGAGEESSIPRPAIAATVASLVSAREPVPPLVGQ